MTATPANNNSAAIVDGGVGVYTRMSLDASGEALGVARQYQACADIARSRGLTLSEGHYYSDNDVSAAGKAERKQFERLLADMASGRIKTVIAWAMDRITRNSRDTIRFLEAAKAAGIRVILAQGGELDLCSPMGQFTAELMAGIAKLEIETKAARQRAANLQRAKLGIVFRNSRRPFGWMPDKHTPHPVEAPAVAEAIKMIVAGATLRSIAAKWNTNPELKPTRGAARWTHQTVKEVLLNPHHVGYTSIHGEILGEANTPHLVDRDLWHACRAILTAKRGKGVRGVRTELGGIALCPCGEPVIGSRTSSGVQRYRHVRPPGVDHGNTYHVARLAEPVNLYMGWLVCERMRRPDAADLLKVDDSADIAQLQERRVALLAKLDGYVEDELEGRITRRQLHIATERINAQVAEIDAALRDASKAKVLGPLVDSDDPEAVWLDMHVDQRRAVYRELFEEIVLLSPGRGRGAKKFDPNTVRIKWRKPPQ